jgi:hypothetical protein
MVTQSITAAVLFSAGDVIAQQAVEGKGRKHDVSGIFLFGPLCVCGIMPFSWFGWDSMTS